MQLMELSGEEINNTQDMESSADEDEEMPYHVGELESLSGAEEEHADRVYDRA